MDTGGISSLTLLDPLGNGGIWGARPLTKEGMMFRITETLEDGSYTQKDITKWPNAMGLLFQWILARGEKDGHNHKVTYTVEWI